MKTLHKIAAMPGMPEEAREELLQWAWVASMEAADPDGSTPNGTIQGWVGPFVKPAPKPTTRSLDQEARAWRLAGFDGGGCGEGPDLDPIPPWQSEPLPDGEPCRVRFSLPPEKNEIQGVFVFGNDWQIRQPSGLVMWFMPPTGVAQNYTPAIDVRRLTAAERKAWEEGKLS